MRFLKITLCSLLVVLGTSIALFAMSEPMIFPKNGQSREQQQEDRFSCENWAKSETGINPDYLRAKIDSLNENMTAQAAGKSSGLGRSLVRGAALGAAMGGLDDAIDSGAGSGAAKGAVLLAAKNREDQRKVQQQAAVEGQYAQKEQLEQQYDTYLRAFSVCMDAKGYSVK
jgi:hypothetical protein